MNKVKIMDIRPRPTEDMTVSIPADTLESLRRVAASREMTLNALIKFYLGQGLRQDLARLFSDRVLETTAHVLSRHLQSAEEVSAILQEIRGEAAG